MGRARGGVPTLSPRPIFGTAKFSSEPLWKPGETAGARPQRSQRRSGSRSAPGLSGPETLDFSASNPERNEGRALARGAQGGTLRQFATSCTTPFQPVPFLFAEPRGRGSAERSGRPPSLTPSVPARSDAAALEATGLPKPGDPPERVRGALEGLLPSPERHCEERRSRARRSLSLAVSDAVVSRKSVLPPAARFATLQPVTLRTTLSSSPYPLRILRRTEKRARGRCGLPYGTIAAFRGRPTPPSIPWLRAAPARAVSRSRFVARARSEPSARTSSAKRRDAPSAGKVRLHESSAALS